MPRLSCWPGLAQVAQLKRSVTTALKRSEEVVYLITNLSPLQASPGRLLHLIRGHWSMENGLHYVRDVTFQEDRSPSRTGQAPQMLAALRESRDRPYPSARLDTDCCHTTLVCLSPGESLGSPAFLMGTLTIIHRP